MSEAAATALDARKKNIRRRCWAKTLMAICALIIGVSTAMAQVDTGSVLGTVKDSLGAVVPDAKVTIINQGTTNATSILTRSDGTYVVTPLKIGTCRIEVEHAGFKKAQNAAFDLNIQQQAVADFTLQLGEVSQTVQVTSTVELL